MDKRVFLILAPLLALLYFPAHADDCDSLAHSSVSLMQQFRQNLMASAFDVATAHPRLTYGPYLALQCHHYGLEEKQLQKCMDSMNQLVDDYFSKPADKLHADLPADQEDLHFTRDLVALLNEPEVVSYLQDLHSYMDQLKQSRQKGDLWQFTLAKAGGDRAKAVKWLGVLFQDTSAAHGLESITIEHYLGKASPALVAWKNAQNDLLERNRPQGLRLYPATVDSSDPRLYHFYTIAYMTDSLRAEGHEDFAGFSPLLLNATYEYNKIPAPAENYAAQALNPEPKTFDPADPESKSMLKSIYLSYSATLLESGKEKSIGSYDEFEKNFAQNPNGFLKTYLQTSHK